jgi:hypothetical protein
MSTAVQNAVRGTVKSGRWVYPAVRHDDGTVARNTKRDGSGDWVDADATKFVAEGGVPEQGTKADANAKDLPKIDGFTDEGHSDYDDLRVAYKLIFDNFASTYEEIADQLGSDLNRAKTVVSMLRDKELVVTDRREAQGKGAPAETIIQSYKTYDSHTEAEVMADFAEAFQPGVKIRRSSGHGGKVGAQHKKPGKSTWTVGSKCPQGHKLREQDIYEMPSGRKQCKKCRAGYPANASSK